MTRKFERNRVPGHIKRDNYDGKTPMRRYYSGTPSTFLRPMGTRVYTCSRIGDTSLARLVGTGV